jgi:ABC-type transporter Mla subunit MlaD
LPDNKQEPNPNGEELEGSRVAELERLISERDEALAAKEQRIAELERALAEKDNEIAALTQSAAELEQKLAEREESLAQAIASYKALIVKYNPGVAEEQLIGDNIEEIDASLASAQALINRVRQELEAEIAAARIPAGAPQRTPADLSALSPRDKIQYAIGERR